MKTQGTWIVGPLAALVVAGCNPPCPQAQLSCGDVCIDPAVDPRNCGACGNACALGQVCSAGQCSPTTGLTVWAGQIGGAGYARDYGADARFNRPGGVVGDGQGNLFIADTQNHVIRHITLGLGLVETIAGTPLRSGSIDGVAPDATLSLPRGLALDPVGRYLYFTELASGRIRRYERGIGEVITLAGGVRGSSDGVGAAARFNRPEAVVANATSLYIADSGNHTIRRLDLATREVTTIAGTPGSVGALDGVGAAARFNRPRGLLLDGTGGLYIADSGNHTIRRLDLASGQVSTLAGSPGMAGSNDGVAGQARFNVPTALTTNGSGELVIADALNRTIRSLDPVTGRVFTLAGTPGASGSDDGVGAAARFAFPLGLVQEGDSLYITDSDGHTLRRLNPVSREVVTLAGTPAVLGSADGRGMAARFVAPEGVAYDGAGNLYVADTGNATIRRVDALTGDVSTVAGSPGLSGDSDGRGAAARFVAPGGLVHDRGNLYVTDFISHVIRQVVLATGEVTTLAGSPGAFGSSDGRGAAARFFFPVALAADGAGNLYVSDLNNNTIRRVVIATGEVTTLAGSPQEQGSADGTGPDARFSLPWGLAWDGAGSLYVVDRGNHTIRRVVVATGAVTTIAGTAGLTGNSDGNGAAARFADPTVLAWDGAGSLAVFDAGNFLLRRINVASGEVRTVLGQDGPRLVRTGALTSALLNEVRGLAFIAPGVLALSDGHENALLLAGGL